MPRSPVSFAICLALAVLASCSYGPRRVEQPKIDPAAAGRMAIEMYDTNHDGLISGDELEKAPALKAALPRLDANGDGAVSADEIAERVRAWKAMQTGMTSMACHVTLDGQPLADAKITLEPEPFLGEEIKAAYGATNELGGAAPTIPKEQRPDPNLPGGVHFGLYKVRISKIVNGKETLPARFNTETVLGQEVSYDDPGMKRNNVHFDLKSGM